MINLGSILLLWALVVSQAQCLFITKDIDQYALLPAPTTTSSGLATVSPEIAQLSQPSSASIEGEPLAVITPAPEAIRANIQKRQPCCFNEQGFRVDCATWTGYYCVWKDMRCDIQTNIQQIPGVLTATRTKAVLNVTETGMVKAATGQITARMATAVR
jgi:hypothetical protein